MDIFYPQYYKNFACIASACPDSCCKEWSVSVDANAAAYYRKLPGTLGDRLREVLQDTDDGTIMNIEDGRCPMWRQDGLCRIQAELGHDALCQVCRDFPRLRHDYGSFAELGLELSCPEAARLILGDSGVKWAQETVPGGEEADYEAEIMDTLLRTRLEFLEFLEVTPLPMPQILAVLLLYAHEVQAELDGGETAVLSAEDALTDAFFYAQGGDLDALRAFFSSLEILTPAWENRLHSPAPTLQWENCSKALVRYFICRYWLQAVSDYDVLCRAKFVVVACLLIASLGGEMVETAQLFSKEIENDADNVEAILDGAYTCPAMTDVALLGLLLKGV